MKPYVLVAALAAGGALSACAANPLAPRAAVDVVAAPPACGEVSVPVYFARGSHQLTSAALHALGETAGALRGCRVDAVQVVGLNDARERDPALSQRRAEAVTRALTAQGLPAPTFEAFAGGQAGATAAPGVAEPLNRRTEIRIRSTAAAAAAAS